MMQRLWMIASVLFPLACSGGGNSLTGSEGQVYDLSFSSVVILLEGTNVSIKYVGSSGDPAILTVDIADISNVAGSSIKLTDLDGTQSRGVLDNVNGDGNGTTTELTIDRGTVTFDEVPKIGATLSGEFNATLTDGYTLNGSFSAKVSGPAK